MLIGEDRDVVMFVTKASEKEEYLSLSYTYSQMKNAYKEEKFLENVWNSFMKKMFLYVPYTIKNRNVSVVVRE